MLNVRETITGYLPPLWMSVNTIEDDVPELSPGMLVEWTNYEDECEIGIGVIKNFSTERFYDYDAGEYVNLPCAYVTNANPDDPYGYHIPLTHLDVVDSLATYISIYKDEYEPTPQKVYELQLYVATKMQDYGWFNGFSHVPRLLHHADFVQGRAS